jgi:Tfp pilus assembly protein PilX
MKSHRTQPELLIWMLVRLQDGSQGRSHDRSHSQGGYTLVVTMAMLLILAVLLITYAVTSKVDNATSMSSAKSNTGFYAAEAGLNLRAKQIRNKFEGYNRPSGGSPSNWNNCLDADTSNDGTGDFACQTEADAFGTANTKDAFAKQIGSQNATTYVTEASRNPVSIIIPQTETYRGLSAQEYRYDVVSVARDSQSKPTAIVKMQMKSRLVPLFQFAAFYEQDMDITIPPTMTLNGRVHSNNDLYLNAAVDNTLSITGEVTVAGSLYRGLKHVNQCSGTVSVDDPSNPRDLACAGTRQLFAAADLTPWNDQIRVGLTPLTVPPPASFDATPGQLYWDKADLRIALNASTGSIEVMGQDNTPISSELNGACAVARTTVSHPAAVGEKILTVADISNFAVGDIVTLGSYRDAYVIKSVSVPDSSIAVAEGLKGAITSGTVLQKPVVSFSDKTFKNYREKRGTKDRLDHTPIRMLNVDVRGLMGCAETLMDGKLLTDDTDGGLVWFLTVKGDDSETINDYGVRLYNGRDLNTAIDGRTIKGLSIVSDQAVYIRGDYNCGFGSKCNNGNLDDDERKPAAVMADTVNILSNDWPLDDSWSDREIRSTFAGVEGPGRPAGATTVNAAFLAGINITGGVNRGGQDEGATSLGGGLNNYPRFHEDWSNRAGSSGPSNVRFTYQGSMVSLGAPRKANGAFCGSGSTADCNIYNPPIRDWRYDPLFNNAANLPPLTPRAVYLRQERFTRDFEQVSQGPSGWFQETPMRFSSLATLFQKLL